MENASKALLIVAGVLLGLMILSLCIFMYTSVSDYYRNEQDIIRTEQINEFNKQYTSYIRDDVRGNEILTLINKVVDYNKREADVEGIKFERMKLEISLNGKKADFKYPKKYDVQNKDIISDLNNNTNDSGITKISNIIDTIKSNTGMNYTETQLQQFASEISNIFAPEDFSATDIKNKTSGYQLACEKRNSVVKGIIGKEYDSLSSADKSKLREATLEYYQFQNFKRAHFNCAQANVQYDKNTGRIVKLVFKFNGEFE